MPNLTNEQREALAATVDRVLMPLIRGVLVEKLSQVAAVMRDELIGPTLGGGKLEAVDPNHRADRVWIERADERPQGDRLTDAKVDCPRCHGSGDRSGIDCIPCGGSGKVSPERHAELMDPFGTDRRRNLERAAALLIAEIERLDRAGSADGDGVPASAGEPISRETP